MGLGRMSMEMNKVRDHGLDRPICGTIEAGIGLRMLQGRVAASDRPWAAPANLGGGSSKGPSSTPCRWPASLVGARAPWRCLFGIGGGRHRGYLRG